MKDENITYIIAEINSMSETSFDGDVYNNVDLIFEQLSPEKKKALLQGLLRLYNIFSNEIERNRNNVLEITDESLTLQKEIKTIEHIDRIELIKLKTWLTKTLVIFILFSSSVIIFIVSFFKEKLVYSESIKHIIEIIKKVL